MSKEGRSLRPESRGRVLSAFLHHYFPDYIDYGFTASLEDQLDHVSGKSWVVYLKHRTLLLLASRLEAAGCQTTLGWT